MIRRVSPFLLAGFMFAMAGCVDDSRIQADLCPDDEVKDKPGVCGCGVADTDTDANGIPDCLEDAKDLCPDDPEKVEPGVCGCGISDEDADGNHVPDCLDDGLDLCPEDPEKVEPGVCGCGISDEDADGNHVPDCLDDGLDLCPEDPDKVKPGVCGCGISDEDADGNHVPDCLDDGLDLCPEDPDKTLPGICGCGVADVDADGDGAYACHEACDDDPSKTQVGVCGCGVADIDTDGDGTLDCSESCPLDPNKTELGICGCGVADEGEAVADDDGDETVNCLDLCPLNPNKTDPGQGSCDWLDTDGDGVEDKDDACIYNPTVSTAESDCNIKQNGETTIFEIWTAGDFDALKSALDNHAASAATPGTFKIQLMRDIDLNEAYRVDIYDEACVTNFVSMNLKNAEFDGQNHTIRFTSEGKRCALTNPIFTTVSASQIHDLSLDYDMRGKAGSVLANSILEHSTVKNIAWNGDYISGFSSVYGETGDRFSVIAGSIRQSTIEDIRQVGKIHALDMKYYGLTGYLSESVVSNIDIQISDMLVLTEAVSGFYTISGTSDISEVKVSIDRLKVYGGTYRGVFNTMDKHGTFDILEVTMNDIENLSTGEYKQGELSLVNDTLYGHLSNLTVNIGKIYSYEKIYGLMRQNGDDYQDAEPILENVVLTFGDVMTKESIYAISYRNFGTIQNIEIKANTLESTEHSIYGMMYDHSSIGIVKNVEITLDAIKTKEAFYGFASDNYGTVTNYRISCNHLETVHGNINGFANANAGGAVVNKVDMSYAHVKASQKVYGFGFYNEGSLNHVSLSGDIYLIPGNTFYMLGKGVNNAGIKNIVASMRVRYGNYDAAAGNYTDLTDFTDAYCFQTVYGDMPVENYYYRGAASMPAVRIPDSTRVIVDDLNAFLPTDSEDKLNAIVTKLNTEEADVWVLKEFEEDGAKIKIPRLK